MSPPPSRRDFLLVVVLALSAQLPGSGGQLNCDVSSEAALGGCLRRLLENSRQRLAESLDPLEMADRSSGGLQASNITILGMATYEVESTAAQLLPSGGFGLRARVTWRHLHGVMDASITRCRFVLVELCYKVRARPLVSFRGAAADMATTLKLAFGHNGLTFAPSLTDVRLEVANITVNANLAGDLGQLNEALDDPASRAVTEWANEWWRQDRWRVERRATAALDRLIKDKLAGRIRQLLTG